MTESTSLHKGVAYTKARQERAQAMYAYYQQGYTLRQIATLCGLSYQRVGQIFKAYGFPLRKGILPDNRAAGKGSGNE